MRSCLHSQALPVLRTPPDCRHWSGVDGTLSPQSGEGNPGAGCSVHPCPAEHLRIKCSAGRHYQYLQACCITNSMSSPADCQKLAYSCAGLHRHKPMLIHGDQLNMPLHGAYPRPGCVPVKTSTMMCPRRHLPYRVARGWPCAGGVAGPAAQDCAAQPDQVLFCQQWL